MHVRFFAFAVVAAFLAGAISADDKAKSKSGPPDLTKMMESMEKQSTPGEHHKAYDALIGNWTYTGKFMMEGMPPMEMTGKSKREWIMGNRFIIDHVNGETPAPFEGRSCSGFDNHKQKYWYAWVDSMTTALMVGEGTFDPKTKTFTYFAESYDPMLGRVVKSKDTLTIKSKDELHHNFYRLEGGKEIKTMEMNYKRAS